MSRVIQIAPLWELTVHRKPVDPWELVEASEALYRSIKIEGLADTMARIGDNGPIVQGRQISEFTRAVAAYVMLLMERWNDNSESMRRLQAHFELSMPISEILSGFGIFNTSGIITPIIRIKDVVNRISIV